MKISAIVAMTKKRVIGKEGKLPWCLPEDLKRFKDITCGHIVIMGRKTYESIGKPLPDRVNIIMTSDKDYEASGCIVANSVGETLRITGWLGKDKKIDNVFVIGGSEIYTCMIHFVDTLYITKIDKDFDGDTYFPEIDFERWEEVSREDYTSEGNDPFTYSFLIYRKKEYKEEK